MDLLASQAQKSPLFSTHTNPNGRKSRMSRMSRMRGCTGSLTTDSSLLFFYCLCPAFALFFFPFLAPSLALTCLELVRGKCAKWIPSGTPGMEPSMILESFPPLSPVVAGQDEHRCISYMVLFYMSTAPDGRTVLLQCSYPSCLRYAGAWQELSIL